MFWAGTHKLWKCDLSWGDTVWLTGHQNPDTNQPKWRTQKKKKPHTTLKTTEPLVNLLVLQIFMFCQPHQLGHLWMNHIFMLTLHKYQNTLKKQKQNREKKRLTVLHWTCKHKQYQHLRSLACNCEMYFQEGSLRCFCTHLKTQFIKSQAYILSTWLLNWWQ